MSDSLTSNILFFDSGVGGLSVYQEVKQTLPDHNYFYLYDNEAYPYGELREDVLIDRVLNLVSKIVIQEQIDLVVIACNTASTIALPSLRQILSIPVVGVVPAIKPACRLSNQSVALIATPATVKRDYINTLINEFSNNVPVVMLGSTTLVHMAEKKLQGESVDLELLEQELAPLINKVDVAVLGCTHFPLIKSEINKVLSDKVTLIDSGDAVARRVKSLLANLPSKHRCQSNKAFATVLDEKSKKLQKCLISMGFDSTRLFRYQKI
ncbi:glutamate racemase [Vibrio sp.]|nr:glutamate racemase [Vibrio sp.]